MNKNIILRVENISKQYRLGQVGTGTLSHDLNRWWHRIRGKENPYLKIGDINDRSTKGSSDYVWALNNITFDVERGDVLGIIGKNGAGKSTLLKILSKVTLPTTGSIKSKGRIASLLEVGTGFNPELTGRENIYLNGAILGMTKKEITSKLEEIIEFSGCERYIDTPVKRYSSGMTVRLAFAVAAFLEPEILVVDEVLAVGDAEFQKKAIGKMQDISRIGGRTVLFVSHNMAAVRSLCTKGIVLENGRSVFSGNSNEAIEYYTSITAKDFGSEPQHKSYSNSVLVDDFKILYKNRDLLSGESIELGSELVIQLQISILEDISEFSIAMDFLNEHSELIAHVTNEDDGFYFPKITKGETLQLSIKTSPLLFIPAMYRINLWLGVGHVESLYSISNLSCFYIEQSSVTKRTKLLPRHSKFFLPTFWNHVS